MRPETKRWLAKRAAGLLLFVVGVTLFALVAIDVWTAEPSGSLANLSAVHGLWLVVATVLIMIGNYVGTVPAREEARSGGRPLDFDEERDAESVLAEYGYRPPPEEEVDDAGFAYEESPAAVCEECGAENDPQYTYCANCSAKL